MSDFLWPASVIPARSEIMLRDLSSRFSSPFTGTSRTYQRPGGELRMMRLELPPLTLAQKAVVTGLLSKLRGGVHRVWCRDHAYIKRGSFPTAEIVTNGSFLSGTTGWTATNATLTAADGRMRVLLTATNGTASQTVAVTSGVTYAGRAHTLNMTNPALGSGLYLDLGTPGSHYPVPDGLATVAATAGSTSGSFVIATNAAASGQSVECDYASLARCALVKGASQTGVRILIDALPNSTDGLLLEGDQVQIGEELFTVTAPLNSNGSGEGYLTLHRPPRAAPADNAPVIVHEPMGLFMLAENENGWQNVPGRFANVSVSLIEAVR